MSETNNQSSKSILHITWFVDPKNVLPQSQTILKLIHCEKAKNLEKKSPNSFDIYSEASNQLEDFFIIFVAISENLNFTLHPHLGQAVGSFASITTIDIGVVDLLDSKAFL